MATSRRGILACAAGALGLCGLPAPVWAQSWPNRVVRLIVTFPPGGANDIIARLLAQQLSERLGQQFIVDNRVGGGGNIGASEAIRATPDGYTILQSTVANATNVSLYENLNFNFVRDVSPVAGVYRTPLIVDASPTLPVKTIPELIAYAKANPGKINYGSGGIGTLAHIAGEMFKQMAGVDLVHVPYRGSPPALLDLLNSRIDILFDPLPTSLEYVRDGRLKGLAVTTAERTPSAPNVPTVAESLAGYEASVWVGIVAPKATPPEIVEKLNAAINGILNNSDFQNRIIALGAAPLTTTSQAFGKLIVEDTEKWAKIIKPLGIKPE